MKESVLHYIWQYRLYSHGNLKTTDGKAVEIIDAGQPNDDAGPDFFNAKIKIEDTLWAGNVEIHKRSSDWERHNHLNNKAYDNVILHVVEKADIDIFRTNGEKIPQMELVIPQKIRENFEELMENINWIPCEKRISELDIFTVNMWKDRLLTERLEQKTTVIFHLLKETENHWESAFYISLAKSFGFGVNSQPFELTAKSLSLNILAKHKDNLLQLEALLLGQAGFLEHEGDDEYGKTLWKEYRFLKAKYNLTPIEKSQWKLLRIRPENFPHIRLAQFAQLIYKSTKLFSKILETEDIKDLKRLFQSEVSEYWQNHYLFSKTSKFSKKRLGGGSIDILLINTVAPFLFAYGIKKNLEKYCENAIGLLESLPSENNSTIKKWRELGIVIENAFDSQAMLQLKKQYCNEKKCLRCAIGHKLLTQ